VEGGMGVALYIVEIGYRTDYCGLTWVVDFPDDRVHDLSVVDNMVGTPFGYRLELPIDHQLIVLLLNLCQLNERTNLFQPGTLAPQGKLSDITFQHFHELHSQRNESKTGLLGQGSELFRKHTNNLMTLFGKDLTDSQEWFHVTARTDGGHQDFHRAGAGVRITLPIFCPLAT
jgi:hypothetical protein